MSINIDVLDTQHSKLDNAFRRHAFERLRESGALPVRDLVATSPNGATSAQSTLDEMVERGMAVLEGEELVAIDGLSVRPTRHRMRLGDKAMFTWCAADAIGIPAALGEDALVVTRCPHCSTGIVVPIDAGVPNAQEDIVLWLPTAGCSHVVTQFCPDVNFFCNLTHLDSWRSQAGEPVGEALTADEAAELGGQWWAYLNGEA